MVRSNSVVQPNLGLYTDRPSIALNSRMLQDGLNFRVKNGKLNNLNLGWTRFEPVVTNGNDSFTKILLHFDGADTTNYAADHNQGGSPHYWVPNGQAQIDNAAFKFGGSSGLFDGTGDYWTTPDHADFTLGSGPWTFDAWFRVGAADGTNRWLMGQNDAAGSATSSSIRILRTAANTLQGQAYVGGSVFTVTSTSTFVNAGGVFVHCEFSRTGDILQLRINGVQEGGDVAITGSINDSANAFSIGRTGEAVGDTWLGWIDEARLSVGVARHTSNFTAPTAAYLRQGFDLDDPINLITNFFIRGGNERLIIGTPKDLYSYTEGTHSLKYINSTYTTGTVAVSGTTVTGTGTNWDPEVDVGDEIAFGTTTENDPLASWFLINGRTGDTSLTLATSPGTIGATTTYTVRRRFSGDVTDLWSFDTFVNAAVSGDDEWWATNGVDFPIKWNGTAVAATEMRVLGFTCKALRVYSNMMIFGNLVQGGVFLPTDIINSDIGEPSDITTGLSEQFKVHGGAEEIVRMEPLGDTLIIYSTSKADAKITVMQFVGAPLIFTFRQAITGVGIMGPRALANFGDHHEFIGRDSQYIFDGATAREVGQQVWRETIRQQDPARAPLCYTFFDDENGDLVWVLARTTDPGSGNILSPPAKAIGEHYLEEVPDGSPHPASQRSMPFTAAGYFTRSTSLTWDQLTDAWSTYNFRWNDQFFLAAFPLILVGDNDGKVYVLNSSQDADGAGLDSYVRFGRRATGDGKMRGLVRRIYPYATQFSTPLDVTVHLADHAQGPITSSQTDTFDQTLPQGGHFVSPFRRGRFMELEFGTDGPGEPWELGGYDIDTTFGGHR